MSCSIWTLLTLTLIGLCRADDIQCDASQHLMAVCRLDCPPEKTCQNKDGPIPPCAPPMGPCKPQCVCVDGYAKNQYGGYCVTYAQCAQCGKNEYFACYGAYSENCPGSCYCTTGFKRDSNNTCVSTYTSPPGNPSPPTVVVEPPPVVVHPSPPSPEPTETPPEPELRCDNATKHEISACVYGCPPERTCQNRNWPPLPCANPGFPCTQKCICDDGYARNKPDDGVCITFEQCDICDHLHSSDISDGDYTMEEQCDKCPGENEYFQCDCGNADDCVGHCYCESGYVKDINDKCVYVNPASPPKLPDPTTETPPGTKLQCDPANHEVSFCLYPCPRERTCQNYRDPEPPCTPEYPHVCTPTCVCQNGYARNGINGTCVTTDQCPPDCDVTRHERPACTFGCPPERSCQNRHQPPPSCAPPAPWVKCTKKCICEEGYVRNGPNGNCIKEEQCAPDCDVTRHERPACTFGCPPERSCQNRHQPPPSCAPPAPWVKCTKKCICEKGYVRNGPNGDCIKEEECGTELQCDPANHEVSSCRYPCPPERTCQNYRDPEPPCTPEYPHVCTPTCVCQNGYARNRINGTCVTTEQCGQCPGISQYFACNGPYSENCKGSCHCATGYERDCNNICVSTTPTPPPRIYYPPPLPPGYPVHPVQPVQPVQPGTTSATGTTSSTGKTVQPVQPCEPECVEEPPFEIVTIYDF